MPLQLDRRNTTALGRWWWTVDRSSFIAMLLLIIIGFFLVIAGSPPVARRLRYNDMYFVTRHQIYLAISTVTMVIVSMLEVQRIRRLAVLGFALSLLLLMLLPFVGFENKGAIRWLRLGPITMQPSEFMKPCFAIVLAWVFSARFHFPKFPSYTLAIILYVIVAALLIMQPDFGMAVTVTGMFAVQFFLAGMPFFWVFATMGMGVFGIIGAYQMLPHVASRIDRFLDPASGDNYQVDKSIEAFKHGGLLGRGPGEGLVKLHIPDSHTDFIFSVAGEEFGLLFCLMIIAIFAFIVVRGFLKLGREHDMFTLIAVGGLLTQFGIQAMVNMGVAVDLLPAKGMTLPFLSYGGSSMVAIAGGMGMMLALTKKRYGQKATRRRAKVNFASKTANNAK